MNFKELREKVEKKKDYFNEKTRVYNLALVELNEVKDELESYYISYLQEQKSGSILTFEKNGKKFKLKLITNIYGNFDLLTINDDAYEAINVPKNVCLSCNFGKILKLIKYIERNYECELIETI